MQFRQLFTRLRALLRKRLVRQVRTARLFLPVDAVPIDISTRQTTEIVQVTPVFLRESSALIHTDAS